MNIEQLRGRESGHDAVIVCTGPSLLKTPPDLVDRTRYITISMNGIVMHPSFVPDYYVVEDVHAASRFKRDIIPYRAPWKVLSEQTRPTLGAVMGNVCYLPMRGPTEPPFTFETDLGNGYQFGGTVTYLALQLAYYLGCRNVFFLGLDFEYNVPDGEGSTRVIGTDDDPNHFDPSYERRGETWHRPRLDRHIPAFTAAYRAFWDDGGSIVNCTPGTKLPASVFPTGDWGVLLREG